MTSTNLPIRHAVTLTLTTLQVQRAIGTAVPATSFSVTAREVSQSKLEPEGHRLYSESMSPATCAGFQT